MINNGIINETETNVTDFRQFQIKATPEMFDMLSRKVYTNEKLAIIRELSTNGIDSMIEAGTINDKRLKVHMPDHEDPELRIRDYGTGLDDEGMVRVYTYGDTSRNSSNNYVGSFGIGSKSPFAYGDSGFEIISYYNGRKLIYNACKVNGIPQIIKLGEDTTDEPNGVEVKLTIEEKDFYKFIVEAKKFYSWFEYPVDINLPESEWHKENYTRDDKKIAETPNYIIYSSFSDSLLFKATRVMVYMGGILYELPSMFGTVVYKNVLNKVSIILKAPVGTFSLPPSREQISGTDDNKNKLVELLTYVRNDMFKTFFKDDKKYIETNKLSKNEIISYFMSDNWSKSDVIGINDTLYKYSGDIYEKIRKEYIKMIEEEYPWFSTLLKNYKINDRCLDKISDTDLFLRWNLPKIPNARVQKVTTSKSAQNFGKVVFIKDSTVVQWEKFLRLYAKNAKFFSCEVYKRTYLENIKDTINPRYNYEPVKLSKLDSSIILEIKKMAMEHFGMREDQIITSSEFNKKFPLPQKPIEANTRPRHTREKVVEETLLAKKIINSLYADEYLETYKSSDLKGKLVYVYEGSYNQAKNVIDENCLRVITFIYRKLNELQQTPEDSRKIVIYLIQKKFEKKIPSEAIHVKDFILDYIKNHEIMILSDDVNNELDSFNYNDSYRSFGIWPYLRYVKFYRRQLRYDYFNNNKCISEDRQHLIKLVNILITHKDDMDKLNEFINSVFLPNLKTVLVTFGIDLKSLKILKYKKFTIPDLDKWMLEYPLTRREFERNIYDSTNGNILYDLLAYEKLDESKVLLPYNNSLT